MSSADEKRWPSGVCCPCETLICVLFLPFFLLREYCPCFCPAAIRAYNPLADHEGEDAAIGSEPAEAAPPEAAPPEAAPPEPAPPEAAGEHSANSEETAAAAEAEASPAAVKSEVIAEGEAPDAMVKPSVPQRLSTVSSPAAAATADVIRGEVDRVKALTEEQRAGVGRKYSDPEELWLALEASGGEATLILRASWVMKQRGGRLPKRGDTLPPEATITVAELRAIAKASKCEHGALPVIALSHFWRTKEHPDPDGETLELVVSALEQRWEEFTSKGVTDLGLIIDWCALWQAPRTPEQAAIFSFGLKGINLVRSSPSPILTCCAAGHSITRFTFSRLAYARSGMRIEAQQCGSSPPVLTVSRASRTGTRAGRRLNTPSRCSSSRRTRRA